MSMIIYTKKGCFWCDDLIVFLNDNNILFEVRELGVALARAEDDGPSRGQKIFQQKNICDKETRGNPAFFEEMKKLSGQTLAPTVILDDEVYPDTDKEEIKKILNNR